MTPIKSQVPYVRYKKETLDHAEFHRDDLWLMQGALDKDQQGEVWPPRFHRDDP